MSFDRVFYSFFHPHARTYPSTSDIEIIKERIEGLQKQIKSENENQISQQILDQINQLASAILTNMPTDKEIQLKFFASIGEQLKDAEDGDYTAYKLVANMAGLMSYIAKETRSDCLSDCLKVLSPLVRHAWQVSRVHQNSLMPVVASAQETSVQPSVQLVVPLSKEDQIRLRKIKENIISSQWDVAEIKDFSQNKKGVLLELLNFAAEYNLVVLLADLATFDLSQKELFEFAKFCISLGCNMTKHIDKFNLQQESERLTIAKMFCLNLLRKKEFNCIKPVRVVELFNIKEQYNIYVLAKEMLKIGSVRVMETIDQLGLSDQALLIDLAKVCAQSKGSNSLARHIGKFGIKNQQALWEILNIFLECQEWILYDCLNSFLVEPKAAEQLLQILAKYNDLDAIIGYLKIYPPEDSDLLFRLAKSCHPSGRIIHDFMDECKINDSQKRFELAKAWTNLEGLASAIEKFDIQDVHQLATLAQLIAAAHPDQLAASIDKFKISDQHLLMQLFACCFEKDPEATVQHMDKFAIQNEEFLVSFVERAADTTALEFLKNIKHFGSLKPAQLYKLAKSCIENISAPYFQTDVVLGLIFDLDIAEHDHLMDLVKLVLSVDMSKQRATLHALNTSNLPNAQDRQEILRYCVASHADFPALIAQLQINDAALIEELAVVSANQDGLCSSWLNFITDKKSAAIFTNVLKQLTIESKRSPSFSTSELLNRFKSINNDRAVWWEIVKLCAEKNILDLCSLPKIGVKNEQDLIEILEICQQHGSVASSIGSFTEERALVRLENKDVLKRLAMTSAKFDPVGVAKNIRDFKISSEEERFDIAMQVAASKKAIWDLSKFELANPKYVDALMARCFETDVGATLQQYRHFKISPDQLLAVFNFTHKNVYYLYSHIHLLKDLVAKDELVNLLKHYLGYMNFYEEGELLQKLKELGISDENHVHEIFKVYGLRFAKRAAKEVQAYLLPEYADIAYFFKLADKATTLLPFGQLVAYLQNFVDANFPANAFAAEMRSIRLLPDQVDERDNPLKKEKLLLLAETLFLIRLQLTDSQIEWLEERQILLVILNFGRPDLRLSLARAAIASAASASRGAIGTGMDQARPQLKLAKLAVEALFASGVDRQQIEPLFKSIFEHKGQKNLFLNGKNVQILVESLLILLDAPLHLLTIQQKQQMLKKIFSEGRQAAIQQALLRVIKAGKEATERKKTAGNSGMRKGQLQASENALAAQKLAEEQGKAEPTRAELEPEILNNFRSLVAIAGFNKLADLQDDSLNLSQVMEKVFTEALPLGPIDDFSKRYLATFASSRMPMAIVTYAAKILSRKNDALNACLFDFVKSVLEGTFAAKRYQLDGNPHLQKIAAAQPGIMAKWQLSLPTKRLNAVFEVVDSDDPFDLMLCGTEVEGSCQKIDGDPKLNQALLGYIVDGKNRLIAVKDTSGKIVARGILRLMWDGEKPALFLEQVYTADRNETHIAQINQMALDKAKDLGLPLVSESAKGAAYGRKLYSLGSPAPWEYCDAAKGATLTDGMKEKGIYEITKTYLLS